MKSEDGEAGNGRVSEVKVKKTAGNRDNRRWAVKIVFISFFISVSFTFASSQMLDNAGYLLAFVVLAIFIFIGVIFDIIGVAVTVADERPFHSMASHRERSAKRSLWLIKNASKVSSICNDVVGDISAIISGTTTAVIISNITSDFSVNTVLLQLLVSGFVAALTIGGKAIGKAIAMKRSTSIVHAVGKLMSFIRR